MADESDRLDKLDKTCQTEERDMKYKMSDFEQRYFNLVTTGLPEKTVQGIEELLNLAYCTGASDAFKDAISTVKGGA